jgi:saccharopine dehydrogenase-like NADP-dependent oxidoreductase
MKRSFVVLGGAGAIGKIAVRDLFESHKNNRILIADFNVDAARAYAKSFRSARVRAVFTDASKPVALANLLKGCAVVVNCAQHHFNLHVMKAALLARVHYIDLGGLFAWTRKQLKLHAAFKRAGLTAVLGAGCSPGITNVMAMHAAQKLGRVTAVRIRVGARDFNPRPAGFVFPYSAQTIVEEMTLAPWVYERGRFRELKPRTRWERVAFGKPVGTVWTVCTRHSEIATLPLTLRRYGIRACDFKVNFDRPFVNELVKRLRAGWTVREFARLPAPRGKPDDCETARVIVEGGGDRITMDCHAKAKPRWHASAGDIDTGCPPSIVAQMIADGTISDRGVLAPESVVPADEFFGELEKRGMRIKERRE